MPVNYTESEAASAIKKYGDLSKTELAVMLVRNEKKLLNEMMASETHARRANLEEDNRRRTESELASLWYSLGVIGKSLDIPVPEGDKGADLTEQWLIYAKTIESEVQKRRAVEDQALSLKLGEGMDILS